MKNIITFVTIMIIAGAAGKKISFMVHSSMTKQDYGKAYRFAERYQDAIDAACRLVMYLVMGVLMWYIA